MKKVERSAKMLWNRVVSALAVILMLALFVPLSAEAGEVTCGTLGDNDGIRWTYDSGTKTLTLTGEDSGLEGRRIGSSLIVGHVSQLEEICSGDIEKIVVRDCKVIGDASYMFCNLNDLKTIEFYNFDTSNVTNMAYMFSSCGITELDLSNIDTSKVTNMEGMFSGLGITELDLSNFDTSKVTNMNGMFYECRKLLKVNVSNFDTTQVTYMGSMFEHCNVLSGVDVSNFNTAQVTGMEYMFYECSGLTTLDVSNFDTSKVADMSCMFSGCSGLTVLDVSDFDTSQVTDMGYMFDGCSKLIELDVSNFNTSKVTDMRSMFYECGGLTTLDVSNFDTSQVTEINTMFTNCSRLTELDVSKFDTTKVTDMRSMFYGCSGLTELDVSKFNTAKVINMGCMFYGCCGLSELDLRNFDISQVSLISSNRTWMEQMLYGCTGLSTIYTPKKIVENLKIELPYIFYDSKQNSTKYLTSEFCNEILTKEMPKEANIFADVPVTSWYYPFVKEVYNRGYMAGTGTDASGNIIFKPLANVTREQFVQILYNIEGTPTVQYRDIFPDVPEQGGSVWYSNAIMWAVENDIASGYNNGLFGVGDNITREQVAVMLLKYATYKGYDTSKRAELSELKESFSDANEIHDWAADSMCWAVENGVMKGTAGGKLMPLGNATRAEAATMLLNMLAAYGE